MLALAATSQHAVEGAYNIGRAIRDITGPASEANLMGYAVPGQLAGGIHMRLRARAFVFQDRDETTGDLGKLFAFVSADIGMASDLVTQKVVEGLEAALPGVYSYENVCISGTHTHSSPAGFLQYTLFQVTSFGFVPETYNAYVDGIVAAVLAAHDDMQPAVAKLANGELEGANINRSPTSYLENPEDERALYDADTDLNMVLLRIEPESDSPSSSSSDDEVLGCLNWFAVHGTSLNNTNRLLSGDNRGYASYYLERQVNGPSEKVPAGSGDFVAAFASTNLGDVSPNTKGAVCVDTGLPCDAKTSTCPGKYPTGETEKCIASGPGEDMYDSCEIIGHKQYTHAGDLMDAAAGEAALEGPVDYRHLFIDMTKQTVALEDGTTGTTCPPAMGYAFAAGTTDGPGMFNFHQATNETTPFWEFVSDILSKPSDEQVACQAPKPILLNLGTNGGIQRPYEWDAEVVPVQLLRLGSLFIAAVPSEFTTMAGRRLRSAIATVLVNEGMFASVDEVTVVIAGLANSYSDYVTTYEEYQAQRYEAASTIYGPHTHTAYMQLFEGLAKDMATNVTTPSTIFPPDLLDEQLVFLPDPIYDSVPEGNAFGDVMTDVLATVASDGKGVASAKFLGANPRSVGTTPSAGNSFIAVEREEPDGSWTTILTDADPETRFEYKRFSGAEAGTRHHSFATVSWYVPEGTAAGTYRLKYFGDATKQYAVLGPKTEAFEGTSSTFEVLA